MTMTRTQAARLHHSIGPTTAPIVLAFNAQLLRRVQLPGAYATMIQPAALDAKGSASSPQVAATRGLPR